jgi:hypothetical protein
MLRAEAFSGFELTQKFRRSAEGAVSNPVLLPIAPTFGYRSRAGSDSRHVYQVNLIRLTVIANLT